MKTNTLFKKLTAVTLSMFVSLSMMLPMTVKAEGYDTTAPVINSLTLSSTELNAGDTLTLIADITEEETGIESAVVYIHRPDGSFFAVGFPVAGGASLSGAYTTSYTFDEYTEEGEYQIVRVEVKDCNNNVTDQYYDAIDYANSRFFTIHNNGNVSDHTAPVLTSVNVESDTIEADGTNYAVIECHDTDLMSLNVWYRATDYPTNVITSRYISTPVELNSEGLYRVALPTSTYYGNWQITSVSLFDNYGNQGYTEVINGYGKTSFTVTAPAEPVDIDVTAPTIDSVTGTTTDIIIPGVASLNVSGKEAESASVTVSVGINYNGRNQYYRKLAEVVDGKYSADFTLEFDSTMPAGTYRVWTISVTDANNNNFNQEGGAYFTYNLVNQYNDVTLNTSLANPNLVDNVASASEGSRFIIKADGNNVSEDLFTAIAGTDKTLVFDMDGIQWSFNGKDIDTNNIKDIDISTYIMEADITGYGYEKGTSGVIFDFASNGILPGTATIKIKSDYITNKFDLSDNLFLACIRDSVEDEKELSYNNDSEVISMNNVDEETIKKINSINANNNELVQIENVGVTLDSDGYVTIKMNHNSSYILTDKLPKITTTTTTSDVVEEENNTPVNNDSPVVEEKEEAPVVIPSSNEISESTSTTSSTVSVVAGSTVTTASVANTTTNVTTSETTSVASDTNNKEEEVVKDIITKAKTNAANVNKTIASKIINNIIKVDFSSSNIFTIMIKIIKATLSSVNVDNTYTLLYPVSAIK